MCMCACVCAGVQRQPAGVQRRGHLRVRRVPVRARPLRQELRVLGARRRVAGAGARLPPHQRQRRPAVLQPRHLHLRRVRVQQDGGPAQGHIRPLLRVRQLHLRHEQGLPVLGPRPRRVRVRQVQLPPRVQRARLPVPRGPDAVHIQR